MKKRNSLVLVFSFIFIFAILSTSLCNTAFAAEKTSENSCELPSEDSTITPYSTNFFVYPSNTTVTISRRTSKVTYTGVYSTINGHSGVIVLRFTNTSTGDIKSWTFIVNNAQQVDRFSVPLEAGTYQITQMSNTVQGFVELSATFN